MDNYEQKYKEALECIQEVLSSGEKSIKMSRLKLRLQPFFPELKELEDQRIRGAIIDYLKDNNLTEWAVWLEKQGEQKAHLELKAGKWYICHRAYCCRADHLTVKEGERFLCQKDGVVNGYAVTEPEKYFRGISAPIEATEATYTTEVETGDGGIKAFVTETVAMPKSKVGDWVVFNNKRESVYQIEKIENFQYTLRHILGGSMPLSFSHEGMIRAWAIADAKDGDALVTYEACEPKIVFILKRMPKKGYALSYYCYYNIMYPSFKTDKEGGCIATDDIKPATKEQRELLFLKMHEAGYEWDAEKKELKKIEQSISIPFGAKDSELQEVSYYIPEGFHAEIDGNKVVIKKGEQKPAWSEEDEERVKETLAIIETVEDINKAKDGFLGAKMWLNSLKERYTWKPSDEQMENLSRAFNGAT